MHTRYTRWRQCHCWLCDLLLLLLLLLLSCSWLNVPYGNEQNENTCDFAHIAEERFRMFKHYHTRTMMSSRGTCNNSNNSGWIWRNMCVQTEHHPHSQFGLVCSLNTSPSIPFEYSTWRTNICTSRLSYDYRNIEILNRTMAGAQACLCVRVCSCLSLPSPSSPAAYRKKWKQHWNFIRRGAADAAVARYVAWPRHATPANGWHSKQFQNQFVSTICIMYTINT